MTRHPYQGVRAVTLKEFQKVLENTCDNFWRLEFVMNKAWLNNLYEEGSKRDIFVQLRAAIIQNEVLQEEIKMLKLARDNEEIERAEME